MSGYRASVMRPVTDFTMVRLQSGKIFSATQNVVPGPSRHLVQRSDVSEIGGEAEVTQRSTFSTAKPSLFMPVSCSPSGYRR
jgi:hypothetical protein